MEQRSGLWITPGKADQPLLDAFAAWLASPERRQAQRQAIRDGRSPRQRRTALKAVAKAVDHALAVGCKPNDIDDALAGYRTKVVRAMIQEHGFPLAED